MTNIISDLIDASLNAALRFSAIFFCSILLFACGSSSQQVMTPKFEIVETGFAKGVSRTDDKFVFVNPTNTFTVRDTSVISYVKFANLSGRHNVKWEWYDPDQRLYYSTQNHALKTSEGNYVEETATLHKISIKGDLAQKYTGEWKVKIYLDDKLTATNKFMINPDVETIAYDVDSNIPVTNIRNPDAVAVIIGNQNYQHHDIPDVKYARNDAEIMKKYLVQTLGYREGNIIFEADATKAKFEVLFGVIGNHRGTLYEYVKPNKSDVFVYYSGHGAPDVDTNLGFFVPVDCDPGKIAFNGYSLDLFYENLSKIEARRLTIVLDSCFSGGTNTGQWLIKGASPALIKLKKPKADLSNGVVLSSSAGNQVSSWYDDKKHGLFTYFFLRAMAGAADTNQDDEITIQEIYDFVSDRAEGVPYWAKRLHNGRTQTPVLQGLEKEFVFVKF